MRLSATVPTPSAAEAAQPAAAPTPTSAELSAVAVPVFSTAEQQDKLMQEHAQKRELSAEEYKTRRSIGEVIINLAIFLLVVAFVAGMFLPLFADGTFLSLTPSVVVDIAVAAIAVTSLIAWAGAQLYFNAFDQDKSLELKEEDDPEKDHHNPSLLLSSHEYALRTGLRRFVGLALAGASVAFLVTMSLLVALGPLNMMAGLPLVVITVTTLSLALVGIDIAVKGTRYKQSLADLANKKAWDYFTTWLQTKNGHGWLMTAGTMLVLVASVALIAFEVAGHLSLGLTAFSSPAVLVSIAALCCVFAVRGVFVALDGESKEHKEEVRARNEQDDQEAQEERPENKDAPTVAAASTIVPTGRWTEIHGEASAAAAAKAIATALAVSEEAAIPSAAEASARTPVQASPADAGMFSGSAPAPTPAPAAAGNALTQERPV